MYIQYSWWQIHTKRVWFYLFQAVGFFSFFFFLSTAMTCNCPFFHLDGIGSYSMGRLWWGIGLCRRCRFAVITLLTRGYLWQLLENMNWQRRRRQATRSGEDIFQLESGGYTFVLLLRAIKMSTDNWMAHKSGEKEAQCLVLSFHPRSNCLQIVTSARWVPKDLQILQFFYIQYISVFAKYIYLYVHICFSLVLVTELHTSQSVAAQPLYEGPKRGHRQVILVDAQPGGQARQVCAPPCRFHGDVPVREAARQGQEAGGGTASGGRGGPQRCHALAQQQRQRGAGSLSRESAPQVTINCDE